jgi:hypothetical protein
MYKYTSPQKRLKQRQKPQLQTPPLKQRLKKPLTLQQYTSLRWKPRRPLRLLLLRRPPVKPRLLQQPPR